MATAWPGWKSSLSMLLVIDCLCLGSLPGRGTCQRWMIFLEPREIISKDVTFQELSRGFTTFDWLSAKDQKPL